jgi:agmatine deiminase
MIPDSQTNTLFLADALPKRQPVFWERLEKVLQQYQIPFHWISATKDIWAVDFMPVQVNENKLVQFTYAPDYLKPKQYHDLITDVDEVCELMSFKTIKSDIVLDGGNVSKYKNTVVMCDKVFNENPHYQPKVLIAQLKGLLEIEHLYFIPWDINDFKGHADGMIRFIDEQTVLINDYAKEDKKFQLEFLKFINNTDLNTVEMPYHPPNDATYTSATGLYLNYLEMEQAILFPIFESIHDEKALQLMQQAVKNKPVLPIVCNELAQFGGILNCITWNIKV